jgi:ribosomal protein S18 acetylase RimI-like enzyme
MANIASEMAIVENAAQLAVVANADRIESDLSRSGAWTYCFRIDNLLVGYAFGYPVDERFHLDSLMVLPAFWGQGIGRMLLRKVINHASEIGTSVDLWVDAVNLRAQTLYESEVFWHTGETRLHTATSAPQLRYRRDSTESHRADSR